MNDTNYTAAPDPIYDPAVLFAQLDDLPRLTHVILQPLTDAVSDVLRSSPRVYSRVVVVGDGDSYMAGHAVDLAFRRIAGAGFEVISAQRFLDYAVDWLPQPDVASTLVIGVSASGATERTSQALGRARHRGLSTVALAGRAGLLSETAERTILVDLPDGPRSPGVRTFHGSCLTLFLLAIELGERSGRHDHATSQALRAELLSVSEDTTRARALSHDVYPQLIEWVFDSPVIGVLGSGPSYGTALYAAAKLVESSGVMVFAQDLEEWHHVERFAYPLDMPVFVIAPSGRTSGRAAALTGEAIQLGRRTVLVAPETAPLPLAAPFLHLRVPGGVREEFSPLLFHVGLTGLAALLARRLSRSPFQADVVTGSQDAGR